MTQPSDIVSNTAPTLPVEGLENAAVPSGIETRSIDYIPWSERYSSALRQSPIWFMGQFQLLSFGLGFIGPSLGLSLKWTLIAGFFGSLFGTAVMALHARQGPAVGLPQMIQSRPQFGFRGAIIPVSAALVDFIGYNIVCVVIVSSGAHAILHFNVTIVTIIIALVTGFLAIYGHEWVHRFTRYIFAVALPIFILLTIVVMLGVIPSDSAVVTKHAADGFILAAFAAVFAATAVNGIAFAPLVSDFSRYLKPSTPLITIFGAMLIGATLATFWMMALGAWSATHLVASGPVEAIFEAGNVIHPVVGIILVVVGIGVTLIVVTMNNYCASLSLMTIRDSFKPIKPNKMFRALAAAGATAAWTILALLGGQNIIDVLWLTLTVLLYILGPWSAINVVDFFFVRRGHYAVLEIFKPNGIYGQWAWRGLLSYAIGIVSMVPFAVLPGVYTGPLATAWTGGLDIAWGIGLIIPAIVYWVIRPSVVHEAQAYAESQRQLEGASKNLDG